MHVDVQHQIHVSGSLNESPTALVSNAENLDLHCAWRNEENAQRVAAAEASFIALWADRHPAFHEFLFIKRATS